MWTNLTWSCLFTATYFMTYHSVCKTNEDYISALRWARNISANITRTMNNWPWRNVSEPEPNWEDPTADDRIKHKVFPYRWVWGCRIVRGGGGFKGSYLCYMQVGNATGCHAGHQDVSRYSTRGESEASIVHKRGIHPGFETQGRHHQMSKTEV